MATAALAELRSRFDVVICEGAGSPAEVNLRDRDLANMALARAADLPVLVVGDIDRGGVLAHFAGTLGVLDAGDQRHIAGFVVNKFRGDPSLLAPGLDWLQADHRPADVRRAALARRALARRRGLARSRQPRRRRSARRSARTCCGSRSCGCPGCRT